MEHKVNDIRDALERISRNDSRAEINVHGASSWQLTVCLLAAAVGLAFGTFGLYVANDTRNQVRIDTLELRQDIKAIRAYINAGMVRPKEK
jgi:hypothetical protein